MLTQFNQRVAVCWLKAVILVIRDIFLIVQMLHCRVNNFSFKMAHSVNLLFLGHSHQYIAGSNDNESMQLSQICTPQQFGLCQSV